LAETNLDVTVSFITTQLQWQETNDVLMQPNSNNGIKKTSIIRLSKIATIDTSLVLGKIGALNNNQMNELNTKLKAIFKLP
jgi:mRNA interferase MazF